MNRLLCLSLLAVSLSGCSGEPEQQTASVQTPPVQNPETPPAVNSDANTPDADSATIKGRRSNNVPGNSADTGAGNETTNRSDKRDATEPRDANETRDKDASNTAPPREPVRPRETAASKSKPKSVEAKLTAAFPSSLGTVGLNSGDLIPEIIGNDIEGTEFRLSDYKGKVIMLDFWGDW